MSALSHQNILELHQAALSAKLYPNRVILLSGIDNAIVASLPFANSPSEQILSDLFRLNEIGTTADGTSPLLTWIHSAAAIAGDKPESEIFKGMAEQLGQPYQRTSHSRSSRLRVLLSVVSLAAGVISFTFREAFYTSVALRVTALVVGGGLALGGVVSLLLLYLRGDLIVGILRAVVARPRHGEQPTSFKDLLELRRSIAGIEARLASMDPGKAEDSGDASQIIIKLRNEVMNSLTEELEARLESRIQRIAHIAAGRRVFNAATSRLQQELSSVARRSNLNLVIGVITTGIAVALLGYMALGAPADFASTTSLLSHYVPRLTTVAFIEIFSFFFLRLYRNGLTEIRYYQDQLTELARREVSLEAALGTSDLDAQKQAIGEIARISAPVAVLRQAEVSLKDAGEFIERVSKAVTNVAEGVKGK